MSNNPFQHTFYLKQHSPLLHFLHEQPGATLRATELKPKLDRFIIEHLAKEKGKQEEESNLAFMKRMFPNWLVGGEKAEHAALDYKMKIEIEGTPEKYLVANNLSGRVIDYLQRKEIFFKKDMPYFADDHAIKELEKKGLGIHDLIDAKQALVFSEETSIKMCVFSLKEKLLKQIVKELPYLLAYHNFGARKSKGFGCFSLDYTTIDDFEDMLRKHPTYRYALFLETPREGLFDKLKIINKTYQMLKSGIGDNESLLKLYCEELDIYWEKDTIIGELVIRRGQPNQVDYSFEPDIKFIRALLGLAEQYEFPQNKRTNVKKVKIEHLREDQDLIERFASPIRFKIFEDTIYILYDLIDDRLFDAKFKFTQIHNRAGQNVHSIIIETPSKDTGFNLLNFISTKINDAIYDNKWEEL